MIRCRTIFGLLILFFSVGCDGFTSVDGRVLDRAGNPVSGAAVELTPMGNDKQLWITKSESDEQGAFAIGMTNAPGHEIKMTLRIKKIGYATRTMRIRGNVRHSMEIVLERVENDVNQSK
jgi:Carboxypeptidase regulatory-like domain